MLQGHFFHAEREAISESIKRALNSQVPLVLPILQSMSIIVVIITQNCYSLFQGFSVEGRENIQEILSKQLYLCQFLCAISILRTGRLIQTSLSFFHYFQFGSGCLLLCSIYAVIGKIPQYLSKMKHKKDRLYIVSQLLKTKLFLCPSKTNAVSFQLQLQV